MSATILETIRLSETLQPALMSAHTIARGQNGRLYLSDELHHRIVIIDSQGAYHGVIGASGTKRGEFRYPRGLAVVESEGRELLAVCDAWSHRLQFFTLDGKFVSSFGSIGSGRDHFDEPSVVLPYGEHCIAVLDRGNHRIKLCSISGETLAVYGGYAPYSFKRILDDPIGILSSQESNKRFHLSGYKYPEGMAITADGAFVVADTGNRLISIFRPGTEEWTIIELDRKCTPFAFPEFVTVLPDGNIAAWVQADAALWLIEGLAPHRIERLPWPELAATKYRPGIFSEAPDTLMVVDARAGTLMRCRISAAFSRKAISPPADMTMNQAELWLEYFRKAENAEPDAAAIVEFIAVLKKRHLDQAKLVARKESHYAKMAKEQHAFLIQAESRTAEGGPADKQLDSKSERRAQLGQAEESLVHEERVLFQGIALLVLLFRSLPEKFVWESLGVEEESFRLQMEEELKHGTDESHATLHRLRDYLLIPANLDFSQSVHDCIRLLRLHQNACRICAVLNALPSRAAGEPKCYEALDLPVSLRRFMNKTSGSIEEICPVLVLLCIEWELDESARVLLEQKSNRCDPRASVLSLLRAANGRRIAGAHADAVRILDIVDPAFLKCLRQGERREFFAEKGHALLELERLGEALACFLEAEPDHPDSPIYQRVHLALVYEKLGHVDEAVEQYPRAMERAKAEGGRVEYEAAATGLVRVQYLSGAFEKATKLISTLPPELADNSYFTSVRAASLQYRPEGDGSALPALQELLAIHPNCAQIPLNLALRYALDGDMSQATNMLDKGKELSSEVLFCFVKGVCQRISGRYIEALCAFTDYEGVVEFPPVPVELFLAAYGSRDEDLMEKALTALVRNMKKDKCFSGFVSVPGRQKTLIEEAMTHIKRQIESRGEVLFLEWLNHSTLRYARHDRRDCMPPPSCNGL